jgi:hypothetical protein
VAGAPVRVRVEFTGDRGCAIDASGVDFHGKLSYARPSPEMRCIVPAIPKEREVDLEVLMPAGMAPGGTEFPRLTWQRRSTQWIGTAHLPAAPAFVRVDPAGSPGAGLSRRLDAMALSLTALGALLSLLLGRRS